MSDKRPWFKHSSKAHLGGSIEKLIAKGDYESIGVFWVLVEKISWNGEGGTWLVQKKVLRNLLRLHPHRMHRVIDEMCAESMIECSPSAKGSDDEVTLQVKLPKWLKLQKPWGGKRSSLDSKLDPQLEGVELKNTKNTKNNTPKPPRGVGPNFKSEIEKLYEAYYPKKRGKKSGVNKLTKEIKNELDLKRLEIAIKNYANERKGREQEFTKHFSTWVTNWEDYAPSTTASSEAPPVALDPLLDSNANIFYVPPFSEHDEWAEKYAERDRKPSALADLLYVPPIGDDDEK